MTLGDGLTEGCGDVEVENTDAWARHPDAWAEQPADEAEDCTLDAEAVPFVQGMIPEGTPQQHQWTSEGGQHPDHYSDQEEGQGTTAGEYGRPRQYGAGGEYDRQGQEHYGRRGTPDQD